MTEEDKKLLHTFEGKLRQLLFLYEELKKENLSLRNEIDRKSAEIAQLECNNKELEAKYIILKTPAYSVSTTMTSAIRNKDWRNLCVKSINASLC